jgi:hypothetical protein
MNGRREAVRAVRLLLAVLAALVLVLVGMGIHSWCLLSWVTCGRSQKNLRLTAHQTNNRQV